MTHKPSQAGPDRAQEVRLVGIEVLQVAGWMQADVGDDVKSVPNQDLAVGPLLSTAGVEACVSQLQALNQQPWLYAEEAVILTERELRGRDQRLEVSVWVLHSFSIIPVLVLLLLFFPFRIIALIFTLCLIHVYFFLHAIT